MASILVVDDDLIIRDLFTRILKAEGYEVLTADSGEKCFEVIAKKGVNNIALVFLDLSMPGIGGEQTLKVLRQCYRRLPVVVISAYGDLYEQMQAFGEGIIDYIPKPFEMDYIKTVVRDRLK